MLVEDRDFFRGSNSFEILKSPLGPSLHHFITPLINNVLWTTDDPIDKETQFKAVHSIAPLTYSLQRYCGLL
jgi:hypothetical protein